MNIDFFDQKDVPRPRKDIKIERLDAEPYTDGWRVKVTIELTPFQERPNLEVRLKAGDRILSELSIIETMHRQMEFTVHIRGVDSPVGDYVAEAELYYEDRTLPQDRREQAFSVR